jgi:hypothetical protein
MDGTTFRLPPGSMTGTQITVSEGHPFHSTKGAKTDIGGEFSTVKSYVDSPKQERTVTVGPLPSPRNPSALSTYKGYARPRIPMSNNSPVFPPDLRSSNATLDKLGTTAIARCAPGNPPINVVSMLGELLHDGLPSLVGARTWESRALTARNAGDEYLNAQFGWAPLVNDVKSFATTIARADQLLAQYERDAGRVVRRRYSFPTQRSSDSSTYVSNVRAWLGGDAEAFWNGDPTGTVTRTRTIERSQWFSGAFTYYLPSGYESRDKLARLAAQARALLGLTLTPDTLWELAPWSWAVDWFSNAGDVIHNVSRFATGGLVMRYGYMMEHTIVKDTYTLDRTCIKTLDSVAPITLVTETKVRRQANPFGFGLTWEGLSSFQASILAALGITHGSR